MMVLRSPSFSPFDVVIEGNRRRADERAAERRETKRVADLKTALLRCPVPGCGGAVDVPPDWTPGGPRPFCTRCRDRAAAGNRLELLLAERDQTITSLRQQIAALEGRTVFLPRPCEFCGVPFTPTRRPKARFCSPRCNTAALRQARPGYQARPRTGGMDRIREFIAVRKRLGLTFSAADIAQALEVPASVAGSALIYLRRKRKVRRRPAPPGSDRRQRWIWEAA